MLESDLARFERENDLLRSANKVLVDDMKRMAKVIHLQEIELATLRMLKADVLGAAIEAGFDGKITVMENA